MPKFYFNKLVRDGVLEGCLVDPKVETDYRILDGIELKQEFIAKVYEEADEIPVRETADKEVIDEIADLQDVVTALRRVYGLSEEDIEEAQERKQQKKGGFEKAAYIESVNLADDSEWIGYFRADPKKYREESHEEISDIIPGIYAHYKSDELRYEVIYIGRHTETGEDYVVYKPLYEHEGQPDIWIRPYEMFVGDVEVDGIKQPRFKFVGKA